MSAQIDVAKVLSVAVAHSNACLESFLTDFILSAEATKRITLQYSAALGFIVVSTKVR